MRERESVSASNEIRESVCVIIRWSENEKEMREREIVCVCLYQM